MKLDIKSWLSSQTIDRTKFYTNPGNGKCVPCYKLIDGELKKLVNKKTGEVLTHNLYMDIQSCAHLNDYLKILKDNPNALDQVRMSIDNGKIPIVKGFDYSSLGTFDDLVQASQKFKQAGFKSFDDIIKAKVAFEKQQKVNSSKKINDGNSDEESK